jgi:hypothetical protein
MAGNQKAGGFSMVGLKEELKQRQEEEEGGKAQKQIMRG